MRLIFLGGAVGALFLCAKRDMGMAKLTARQQRFVDEYMLDLNATRAAIRAGYSARNADKIGPELLGKTRVREAVSEMMAERSRRTGVSAGRVVEELAKIAFANIADVAGYGGGAAARDDTAAIQSAWFRRTCAEGGGETEESEIRLHDKIRALELLGRHIGMFGRGQDAAGGESGGGGIRVAIQELSLDEARAALESLRKADG